ELSYTDLGEVTASGGGATASIEAKGFDLVGVGTYPINPQFDVYGKLGFFRWDLDASASGPGGSIALSESGTDLTFGFGVKYNFTKNVGMRVQWQQYNDIGNEATTGTSDVDVIGVGVVVKF
ncbi:MAG: outer membrane beta-barrel protein, partial [Dongiaceae bacterium]